MNFNNVTRQETREAWEERVLATYPYARFYRYHDGGWCALGSSAFQPADWSPMWRVGQWSRTARTGHVHVPENIALHLTAEHAHKQWFEAAVHTYYGTGRESAFCRIN